MDQHPGLRALQILRLLIFFFWCYTKDRIFATQIADAGELKTRIHVDASAITEKILKNIWGELEYRLAILWATKKVYVEIDLGKWS